MTNQGGNHPPAPYYSIEALIDREWTILWRLTLRSAAIDIAKEMAQVEHIRYHVYLHTRSNQRKHVFTARPPVKDTL